MQMRTSVQYQRNKVNSKTLKAKLNKKIKLDPEERKYLVALMHKHTHHLNTIIDLLVRNDRLK